MLNPLQRLTSAAPAIAFASALALLFIARAGGEPPTPASVAVTVEELEKIRAAHKVPGIVAGCVTRDGVEQIIATGVRKQGDVAVLQATDRMHLGSCNKAITATLAATFVADGKLKWESTLGEILGPSEPNMDAGWKAVTLEQLLRHRGGAPAGVPPAEWSVAWNCTDAPHKCREAFVRTLLSHPPAQPVGTMQYSNQGYSMVGRMCEVVGGEPYEALVMKRVLQPLDIKNAGFNQPSKCDPASPVGHGADGKVNDSDNPCAIAPAGTLHMPTGEWMKFVAFHIGAKPPPALAETAKQLAALHKASDDPKKEALGWMVTERPWGGTVLTHSGSNNLWYCTAWIAPDRGFGVVAACNQGGNEAAAACDQACFAMITSHVKAEALRAAARATGQPAQPSQPAQSSQPAQPSKPSQP